MVVKCLLDFSGMTLREIAGICKRSEGTLCRQVATFRAQFEESAISDTLLKIEAELSEQLERVNYQ